MDARHSDLIFDRLEAVRREMAAACARVGRDAGGVDLVAVTKTHGPAVVREAYDGGQRIFGENRVQELLAKAPELPGDAQWHHIGHLQKNKIRKLLPHAALIHGVDSVGLALEIDRVAAGEGLFPKVLLQVNLAGEASKFGLPPGDVERTLEQALGLGRVEVVGLMTIPPAVEDPEDSRPLFRQLRELRDTCSRQLATPLPVLSMGMSGDFAVAIEEGATLVRVGSAIFGARGNPREG